MPCGGGGGGAEVFLNNQFNDKNNVTRRDNLNEMFRKILGNGVRRGLQPKFG